MAEKLSLPSSSSNSDTSDQTPAKKQGEGDSKNFLTVLRQPPQYLYLNEPFEFKVGLRVPKNINSSESPTDTVEIVAILLGGENANPENDSQAPVLWIDEKENKTPLCVSSSKPCVIRCMIRGTPSEHIRRDKRVSYYISIATRETDRGIKLSRTVPIQLVNYKIRISTGAQWSNIWYKDEGGRDKWLEVVAELVNSDNRKHIEKIPLNLTLCYAAAQDASTSKTMSSPTRVTNQQIFRMLNSTSKIQSDNSTGLTAIRFRVEDVSKNHQGQDFVLHVSPESGFWDVAPGYSPSISVRSKRSKRQRSWNTRNAGPERRHSPHMPSSVMMVAMGIESTVASPSVESSNITRIQDAIKGVAHWTSEVISGIHALQWQVLGYAPLPNGSPDYSRPYHKMPNPNACISRILSMYSERVRDDLWVLQQGMESLSPIYQQGEIASSRTNSRDEESHSSMKQNAESIPLLPPAEHPRLAIPTHQTTPTQIPGRIYPHLTSEGFQKLPSKEYMPYPSPQQQSSGAQFAPFLSQQQTIPQQHYPRTSQTQQLTHSVAQQNNVLESHATHFTPILHRYDEAGTSNPGSAVGLPMRRDDSQGSVSEKSLQDDVEYVLATKFNSLQTGESLGFPAYDGAKKIIGFYRESNDKVGLGQFVPLSSHLGNFGPMEMMQASKLLEDAIKTNSHAVHKLKDWGSINNLIDHILVFEWSKGIGQEGDFSP